MPICNTVSLSPTHSLFKFQVRFQVANRESAPLLLANQGMWVLCTCLERTWPLSTALCASAEAVWGELGHGKQPPSSQPFGLWPWVRQTEVRKGISFLGPLSICPAKAATSGLVVGARWKQRERAFSWSWGVLFWCILLALMSAHAYVCVCVCGEGWLSWPDLSAP